jgi:hypothetical protein
MYLKNWTDPFFAPPRRAKDGKGYEVFAAKNPTFGLNEMYLWRRPNKLFRRNATMQL